jgi:TM2 domain-containing membrane protein YozV
MNGQVLDFSVQENSGVISGSDGNRYYFVGAEWKGDVPPSRGRSVDFDVKDNNAIGVHLALGHSSQSKTPGSKNKAAVTLWAIFLGGVGAHKFYMGSWGWGIVYLLTFWLYIPFLVSVAEWVRYVRMTDDEFYTKVEEFERKDAGPFGFFW